MCHRTFQFFKRQYKKQIQTVYVDTCVLCLKILIILYIEFSIVKLFINNYNLCVSNSLDSELLTNDENEKNNE